MSPKELYNIDNKIFSEGNFVYYKLNGHEELLEVMFVDTDGTFVGNLNDVHRRYKNSKVIRLK